MFPSKHILAIVLLALAWVFFMLSKKYKLVKRVPEKKEEKKEKVQDDEKKDS